MKNLRNFWHANRNDRDYAMLWAAACMCFFGFMRAGELVVPSDIGVKMQQQISKTTMKNLQMVTVMSMLKSVDSVSNCRNNVININRNTKLCLKIISDDFLVDDVKTKYYTGRPSYELLQVVFSFVTIGLPASFQNGPCSVF